MAVAIESKPVSEQSRERSSAVGSDQPFLVELVKRASSLACPLPRSPEARAAAHWRTRRAEVLSRSLVPR